MQKCFDDKDIQMLQDVISKMDPTVSSFVKDIFSAVVFWVIQWSIKNEANPMYYVNI